MTRQRWISVAGTVAAVGGAAWLMKMGVVAATDGAADGGASTTASVLYVVGVLGLFAGSTWLGVMLARSRPWWVLAALVALSPIAFWMSYTVFDAVGIALAGDGAEEWVKDELGVAFAGAAWLAASVWAKRAAPSQGPPTRVVRSFG